MAPMQISLQLKHRCFDNKKGSSLVQPIIYNLIYLNIEQKLILNFMDNNRTWLQLHLKGLRNLREGDTLPELLWSSLVSEPL